MAGRVHRLRYVGEVPAAPDDQTPQAPGPHGPTSLNGHAPHERALAPSPFPGDDGAPRADVREALGRFAATSEPTDYLRAVAALCGDRLLVPVVATATQVGTTVGGLASDKEAEMAVVLLQRADGGKAMLGFTGLDALQAWDSRARPVPVTVDKVAETATAEGAVAVLVDVAGPHPLVLEGEVLDALARGHRLVDLADGFGWAMPAADRDDTAE